MEGKTACIWISLDAAYVRSSLDGGVVFCHASCNNADPKHPYDACCTTLGLYVHLTMYQVPFGIEHWISC